MSILVLLGTGAIGVYDGLTEWRNGHSLAQQSVTAAVFTYGVLGLAGGLGTLLRRRWGRTLAIGWGVFATYAASVATLVYSDGDGSVGAALAAFGGAAIMVALVVWGTRLVPIDAHGHSPVDSRATRPDLDPTQRQA